MTYTSHLRPKPFTDDDIADWFKKHHNRWSKVGGYSVYKLRRWFKEQTHAKYKCEVEMFNLHELKMIEGYPKAYILNIDTNIGYLVWDIDGLARFNIKDCLWDERLGCYLTV